MLVHTRNIREAWLEGRPNSSNTEGDQRAWFKLWKVDVPSKVRIFLWRLDQNSMPTANLLHDRNITTTMTCGLCGAQESWQHSLLHYSVAQCVWALQDHDLVEALNNSNKPDAKRWIFAIMEILSSADFTQVLVTLWAIWYSRRRAIHESIFQSPMSTHTFIMRYIRELQECRPK